MVAVITKCLAVVARIRITSFVYASTFLCSLLLSTSLIGLTLGAIDFLHKGPNPPDGKLERYTCLTLTLRVSIKVKYLINANADKIARATFG